MVIPGLREALPEAISALGQGKAAVIVTVIADRSLAGVLPGSRLFVPEQGDPSGSLHPLLDSVLVAEARQSMETGRSLMRSYRVTDQGAEAVGVQGADLDIFFEVLGRPPRLIVVGAGHIAQPLARIAKLLHYHVTVLDDRPEYANRDRFPEVDEILVGPYAETLSGVRISCDTSVVLVTRGHVHDQACLELVLDSPAAYIGMIGSKRRVRTVLQHVREAGRDVPGLERLYAPIGLDIRAETPEEIAVAIVAEMIKVRRGGTATSLRVRETRGV